jgi:hypothetical protein
VGAWNSASCGWCREHGADGPGDLAQSTGKVNPNSHGWTKMYEYNRSRLNYSVLAESN